MQMRYPLLAISMFALVLSGGAAEAAPPPSLRVLVIESVPSVTIEGAGLALIDTDSGRRRRMKGDSVRVLAGEGGLTANGRSRGKLINLSCGASRCRIRGRLFRGEISIAQRDDGRFSVINRVSLEDYLAGLINSEISSSWPRESIKAQAVAARTYAMNQMEAARRSASSRGYDITGTTLDQVYDGAHQEDYRSRDAVMETHGEVMLRDGRIFPAYYHSCCGGRTEHAANVWAGEKGPPVVEDSWCARSPKLLWSWRIPIRSFLSRLSEAGIEAGIMRTIAATVLPDSPRNEMVIIEDADRLVTVRATELRRIFGYKNIKSTWFDAEIRGDDVVFTGRGYGHGVGLCQWGAKAMAEAGRTYRDILGFYYPDAALARIY